MPVAFVVVVLVMDIVVVVIVVDNEVVVAVLLPRWRELGTGYQMMASGDLCRKLRHRD